MKRRLSAGCRPGKPGRDKAATPSPTKAMPGDRLAATAQQRRLKRERDEALEREKATAEVLRVMNSSAGDLEPVFNAMVENALRLCQAEFGNLFLYDGKEFATAALHGAPPAYAEARRRGGLVLHPHPDVPLNRVIRTKETIHIRDVRNEQSYIDRDPRFCELVDIAGARTLLLVPMLKDDELVGAFAIYRREVRPFATKQIELVRNFSAQAVIAIENARLLKELRERTNDLSEALQYQTGSADILRVIASSPTDVGPVLSAIVESACALCGAYDAVIVLKDQDELRLGAHHGPISMTQNRWSNDRASISGRAVADRRPVHVLDVLSDEGADFAIAREMSRVDGCHTLLGAPLLRDGKSIGAIVLRRAEVNPFSDKQIALLQTFADQAVIAIGNVRLFEEVQSRTQELAASLDDLRTAQDRLIQTEKLASLGQLTAGIAHEIKNPLNFVNNFAALSSELTDELNDLLKSASLTSDIRDEVDELTGFLKDNLQKVVQHGKRADSIVKNMLLHSREGSGEHRPIDVNTLVQESLNLAYHGSRAEKPQFNVALKCELDPEAGAVEAFPQEITRALLNLIINGFYALTRRKAETGDELFEPVLAATTRNLGSKVEIRIWDNGTGIPPEVRGKIFNPFFTTKPTGEGTGLGLSMAHDIIVKQHGGRIDVQTELGEFTEFIITLPRDNGAPLRQRPE